MLTLETQAFLGAVYPLGKYSLAPGAISNLHENEIYPWDLRSTFLTKYETGSGNTLARSESCGTLGSWSQ
jgi:hypothetical protein